jgi:CelD/BcsL family acetyltransferase involved in cellulose biosynthesis
VTSVGLAQHDRIGRADDTAALPHEVQRIAGEWEQLAESCSALPWMRPGWIGAWWNAFGAGRVRVSEVRDGGELAGVLPLYSRRGVVSSLSNWHTPEFRPLARPAVAAQLLESVLAERPRRLSLGFLERDVLETRVAIETCRAAGYRTLVRTLERSPYITIDGQAWESYERSLKAKLLRHLRRRRRRLEELGPVTVALERGGERLPQLLSEGFAVEAQGWKGDRRTAIASSAHTRQFYEQVAHWAAQHGWLRLAFLRVGARAIAFDFAIEQGRTHYLLKTGFDPAFARFGPGLLLRQAMIENAFRDGLASYEFLGSAEPWKLEWTETTRDRVLVQGFAPTAAGLADWSAYAFARPAVKEVLRMARR